METSAVIFIFWNFEFCIKESCGTKKTQNWFTKNLNQFNKDFFFCLISDMISQFNITLLFQKLF